MKRLPEDAHFDAFPASLLFDWYDKYARILPWRAFSPALAPAYHVFLSELMLQQTGVTTVIPYFQYFTRTWPDIFALAAADEDAVLAAWAGLGYYARARNMIKAARLVVSEYQGKFPQTPQALEKLPGIGPYTAGAIAAIAFDQPAIVIDGNIERILVRYGGIKKEVREIKPRLKAIYAHIRPDRRRSDFPQALMDIGAGICLPRRPNCTQCPLRAGCRAAAMDDPASLPLRPDKKPKPVRAGTLYILRNKDGAFLLGKRPEKGLLGGMLGFPSYGWDGSDCPDWLAALHLAASSQKLETEIRHVFTHFTAEMTIYYARIEKDIPVPEGYRWQACSQEALPSLMAKCYQACLPRFT